MKTRGRPPNTQIDALSVKVWFFGVGDKLGTHSAYMVEKYFNGEKFSYNREENYMIRPCKFDKYKSGKHTPNKALVDKIDNELSDTKSILIHPIWKLLNASNAKLSDIHRILAKLDVKVAKLLFHRETINSNQPIRLFTNNLELISQLDRFSNLDALTACLGLILEFRTTKNVYLEYDAVRCAFRLLSRVLTSMPFWHFTDDIFDILKSDFFTIKTNYGWELITEWNAYIEKIPFYELVQLKIMMILLLEDLGVLRRYFKEEFECLYYVDEYISPEILIQIRKLSLLGDWDKIEQLPEFKKVKRAVRAWEKQKLKEQTIH